MEVKGILAVAGQNVCVWKKCEKSAKKNRSSVAIQEAVIEMHDGLIYCIVY